jgi:tetratricopeptide (TPR) repeat protein
MNQFDSTSKLKTGKTGAVAILTLSSLVIFERCASEPKKAKSIEAVGEDGTAPSSKAPVRGQIVISQPLTTALAFSEVSQNSWISLKSSPQDSLAKLQSQLAAGDWQKAVEGAKVYLRKRPNDPEALMVIAAGNAVGRRFEMAGYYAQVVLKIQPGNSDAMNLIGLRIMMATGNRRADYQDAITWFQKSIDTDSAQIAAALNLGHLQLELGASAEAIGPFKSASERCQQCDRAMLGYGIALSRANRGEDALSTFESLLKKNPINGEGKYQLAMVYKNNLQNPKKAQSILQDLVSDADGSFKDSAPAKRQANIVLRMLKAQDRSGDDLKVSTQMVRPHSKEKPREQIPIEQKPGIDSSGE